MLTNSVKRAKQKRSWKKSKARKNSAMFFSESTIVSIPCLESAVLTITSATKKNFTWNTTEPRDLICSRKLKDFWKGTSVVKIFVKSYLNKIYFFVTDEAKMARLASWGRFVRRDKKIRVMRRDRFCWKFSGQFSVFRIKLKNTRAIRISTLMTHTQS